MATYTNLPIYPTFGACHLVYLELRQLKGTDLRLYFPGQVHI